MHAYNESPIRQGKPFIHYGGKLDKIKQNVQTIQKYPQGFICAFHKEEMIGFIHLIYSKETALMSQILSMRKRWNKAPNNALIAKAVEIACKKDVQYLVYARMSGGSLGEFKRRNGFQKMPVTRYCIPLSSRGKLILTLRLQNGLRGILPQWLKDILRPIRDHLTTKLSQRFSFVCTLV